MPQFANQVPTPGWTVQNQGTVGTLTPDEEQGFGAAPGSFGNFHPALNGYLGWSCIPEDAIATITYPATNTNLLQRVFVPISGTSTKCDFFPIAANGITQFLLGLYGATGVQLSTSPAISSFGTWANSQQTVTWTTPTILVAGNFYYVAIIAAWTTTAPTFAGTQNASAAALNAGLTAATGESDSNGTAASLPASYTMGSNVNQSFEIFVGLK